ncbi:MAG TPA: hypothetical protein VGM05_16900 [Planctomycetaceae bacterium]|jgi:hypothetical protein
MNHPFEHPAIDVTCRGNTSLGLSLVAMIEVSGVTMGDMTTASTPGCPGVCPDCGLGGG